jgi:SAM-dependent methyltransferase
MLTHNNLLARIQCERQSVARLYGNSTESITEEALCKMSWNMFPEEVVIDPEQNYLDYACGKASLLLYGVEFLFKKLQYAISNPQQRLEHIIKKQIYGFDISKPQIDIARSAFKRILKDPDAIINVACEDSLEKDFNIMKKKFNLVTNVPFQNGKDPNFYKKFRIDLNKKLVDILNYKVIISPNYLTLTSKDCDISTLAIYNDLGNAFKSITLPAGVCVTREDPSETKTVKFTDLNDNTSLVSKEDFVVIADSTVLPIIKKIQQGETLGFRYIHDSNKLATENKNGNVFYVDKAGETDKSVKGFYVDKTSGNVRTGSFVVFAYNAPGNPLDVGNKRLGPTKVLNNGNYIFSSSVVAIKFNSDTEAENCKKLLDAEWSKNIIRSVKYATNNSKTLLGVLPNLDFTKEFKEEDIIAKFK